MKNQPRYAPGFESYIREFSDTTVIIDHLGRPFQGTPEEHAQVIRWADFPNTVMKLAAIPSQDSYPHREIGTVIRQLTDAWGADRIIYIQCRGFTRLLSPLPSRPVNIPFQPFASRKGYDSRRKCGTAIWLELSKDPVS